MPPLTETLDLDTILAAQSPAKGRYFATVDLFALLKRKSKPASAFAGLPDPSGGMEPGGDDDDDLDDLCDGYMLALPALPEGTFEHPYYGTLEWNAEKFSRMIGNFGANAMGVAPMLNADHASRNPFASGAPAYGWVDGLAYKQDQGLYANVSLTQLGADAIKSRSYRYLSAEFAEEYTNSRGETYPDVFCGLALTNTPFHDSMPGVFGGAAPVRVFSKGLMTIWAAGSPPKPVETPGTEEPATADALPPAGERSMSQDARPGLGQFLRSFFGLKDDSTTAELAAVLDTAPAPSAETVVNLNDLVPDKTAAELAVIAGQPSPELLSLQAEMAQLKRAAEEAKEAVALARQEAADEKKRREDEATASFQREVERQIGVYVDAGKILPKQREQATVFAKADFPAFCAYYEGALPQVTLNTAFGGLRGADAQEPGDEGASAQNGMQFVMQELRKPENQGKPLAELTTDLMARYPDRFRAMGQRGTGSN